MAARSTLIAPHRLAGTVEMREVLVQSVPPFAFGQVGDDIYSASSELLGVADPLL